MTRLARIITDSDNSDNDNVDASEEAAAPTGETTQHASVPVVEPSRPPIVKAEPSRALRSAAKTVELQTSERPVPSTSATKRRRDGSPHMSKPTKQRRKEAPAQKGMCPLNVALVVPIS